MLRRAIKWCLIGAVILPIAVIVLVLALAQTGPGKRQLAGLIGDLASQPGMTVSVTGITGFVPVDMGVDRIAVADADGTWLSLEDLSLDWSPLALISGTLAIDTLSAGDVVLHRTPAPGPAADPPPDMEEPGPLIPELPLAVRLDRLAVDRVTIDETVMGDAVELSLALSATLGPPADGLSVEAEIERIDATPGRLALTASYVPESQRLSVDLTAEEPAGGVLVRTIDLPGLPPVSARIQGDGTTDDWTGTLTLAAGPSLQATGTLRLAASSGQSRFGTDIDAIVDGVVPADLRGLVDGGIRLALDAALGGDLLSLDGFRLEAAAGRVDLDGHLDLAATTGELGFRIAPAAPAWSAFLPELAVDALTIEGMAAGPVTWPRVQVDLNATSITFGDTTAEALALTLSRADAASDLDHRIEGQVAVTGLALADAPLPALGPDPEVSLTLDLADDGRLHLERLTIGGQSASVTARGDAADWGATASADIQATLAELADIPDLAGTGLAGTLAAEIAVRRDARGLNAQLGAEWRNAVTGIPQVDDALGGLVAVATRLSLPVDGPLSLSDLLLEAGPVRLTGDAVLDGQEVAAVVSASLDDLGAVLDGAAGSLTIDADLYGALDSLAVDLRAALLTAQLAGIDIPELTLEVDASGLPATPVTQIALNGSAAGLPVTLAAQVAVTAGGEVTAEALRLTAGPLEAGGALAASADGLVTGSLDGRVASLEGLSAITGQPLAGTLGFDLALTEADGAQNAELEVDLSGFALGDTAAADRVRLAASATDVQGDMRVSGRLEGSRVETAAAVLDTATVSLSGPLAGLSITLEAAGVVADLDTRLAAQATAAIAETVRIDLTSLSAAFDDVTVATTQPAVLALTPAGPSVEGLRLGAEGGVVALDASQAPVLQADLEFVDLPLALTRLFAPDLITGGRLNGRVLLDASPGAPRAEVTLSASGVNPGALAATGLGSIDIDLAGRLAGGSFELQGDIAGPAGALAITGAVPLIVDGGLLLPPADPSVRAGLRGQLDLNRFNALLSGADRLTGGLDVDLAVQGRLNALAGQGEVRLSDASYANPLVGIGFEGINAVLAGTTDSLRLTQFEARTPNGGRITGQGAIVLDALAGFPTRLTITADDAQVVDRAEATVIVDADLQLDGPVLDTPALTGSVRIDAAELRIPESLPAAFPVIPVTEINLPPELAARRPPPDAGSGRGRGGGGVDPQLDIRIEAPGRIFVRGRGAELELAAAMRVLGRASAPRIEGGLSLRGGTLDLLGNTLTFDRANVSFFGDGTLTPQLDVLATAPLDEITATVTVTGTAEDPALRFSSEPELPEDEVLARLLFGKATGALSPFEALQLADSIATLSGVGGPGVLDRVRERIGIDRLSIGEDDAGGATVSVGSRVTDDVLVTVEQGTGPGSGRVGVEVELTDNIILETDAGADATGRAGIRFQWEY